MSVTWNAQNGVDSYRVYYLRSSKPLNITNIESFLQFYNKRGTLYDAYVNAKGENDSYETDSEYASDPYCNITIDSGLPYFIVPSDWNLRKKDIFQMEVIQMS